VPSDSTAAFVSYSREDSDFALRLAQDLKAAGASVWLDQLELIPGRAWDNAIEDALLAAPEMLVILSPTSVRSENVRDEISYALRQGKTVVPVLYMECTIPLRLERKQHIDVRTDYARGLGHLLRHLNVSQPDPSVLARAAEGDGQRQAAWQAREAEAERLRIEREAREEGERKAIQELLRRPEEEERAAEELLRKQAAERETQEKAELEAREAEAQRLREIAERKEREEAERKAKAELLRKQEEARAAEAQRLREIAERKEEAERKVKAELLRKQEEEREAQARAEREARERREREAEAARLKEEQRRAQQTAAAKSGAEPVRPLSQTVQAQEPGEPRKQETGRMALVVASALAVLAVIVFAIIALRPYLFGPPEGSASSEQTSVFSQPAGTADASATVATPAAAPATANPQTGDADDPVYDQAKASFDSKQFVQARTLFGQDCDSGGLKGCDYLGYLYAQGLGGAQDAEKAAGVYLKACTAGNLSSCASLGSLYEDAGNGAEARTYYQKACDGGVAEGCKLLRGVQ